MSSCRTSYTTCSIRCCCFYFGLLIPILKVDFEFPYAIYQGLTMYLLVAIGWDGGEELATIKASSIGHIVGFMVTGFVLNFVIGLLAYVLLGRLTARRPVTKQHNEIQPDPVTGLGRCAAVGSC